MSVAEELIPQVLAGDHPIIEGLRKQYNTASVERLELSSKGFDIFYQIPEGTPRVSLPNFDHLGGQVELEGFENGAPCVLHVCDGIIRMFEVFKIGEGNWSEDLKVISIFNVSSLREDLDDIILQQTFPKVFSSQNAPREIIALAENLMPLLLSGEHPALKALRQQLQMAKIKDVEMTGHGFFLNYDVPDDAPRTNPANIAGGSAYIEVTGLPAGAGCVVFVENGKLSCLEGYAYDRTWSEHAKILSIKEVTPVKPEERSGSQK
ncbi:hypothetical protein LLG95_01240 [bacterium]|nr:hypothetical protein [bacterium]